ncbi:hypothetical protein ARMGADRAFT_1066202 [Armillaria gallica]|uniref:Uncharacterized protein n=1 Tax=Armillaria gallica TaxID=47427 RepID=A0A2H3DI77_ARMGA|nr:hypothetical protein ARMGADRAFT_1066202 [Armillaria gallica]
MAQLTRTSQHVFHCNLKPLLDKSSTHLLELYSTIGRNIRHLEPGKDIASDDVLRFGHAFGFVTKLVRRIFAFISEDAGTSPNNGTPPLLYILKNYKTLRYGSWGHFKTSRQSKALIDLERGRPIGRPDVPEQRSANPLAAVSETPHPRPFCNDPPPFSLYVEP